MNHSITTPKPSLSTTTTTTTPTPLYRLPMLPMRRRIRIIKRRHRNKQIHKNPQHPLQIITLPIFQKTTHHNNSQYQHRRVKHFKVQTHFFPQRPADEDNKRRVQQCCLDRGAEDLRDGVVHLVLSRFVHGGEVLGDFFDDGDEDEAFELFAEVAVDDDVL